MAYENRRNKSIHRVSPSNITNVFFLSSNTFAASPHIIDSTGLRGSGGALDSFTLPSAFVSSRRPIYFMNLVFISALFDVTMAAYRKDKAFVIKKMAPSTASYLLVVNKEMLVGNFAPSPLAPQIGAIIVIEFR